MLTADDRKLISAFNRNIDWMKMQALKSQPAEVWGPYEEAVKILDRSKEWYKKKRLDRINKFQVLLPAELVKGTDWRMVGNQIEFRLESIKALKEKMSV